MLNLSPNWQLRIRFTIIGILLLLTATFLVSISQYKVHDSDSRLYAAIAHDTSTLPIRYWSAPEWNGHWGNQGYFYEHPPGLFMFGALFGRLGLNAFPAIYLVNFLSWLISLALLAAIAQKLIGNNSGITAVLIWVLSPMFIQYLVRGNQENPITTCVLLGVFACVVLRHHFYRALFFGIALTGAVLIKGAAGMLLVGVIAWVWWLRGHKLAEFLELIAGSLFVVVAAFILEQWHQSVTGASFWGSYLQAQVRVSLGEIRILNKFANLGFYFVRPWWFFFPWIFLLLWPFWRYFKYKETTFKHPTFYLGIGTLAIYIGGFSLFDRACDRYLFPAYPMCAISTAFVIYNGNIHFFARMRNIIERYQARLPYFLAGALAIAVALKVYIGLFHYIYIQPWRGG
ncbi:MAG: glycosyltransferase family 39 protein [Deltaproteobacteria bacterium]|nr:glycosyltransferase family 39 protein [Deltaproteobacteria bacterium]